MQTSCTPQLACGFKPGFPAETQTYLSTQEWGCPSPRSSPAPTGLMALCPPSLCQESLAVFLSSSHLHVTSSPWPFSKLYLPPQVSSLCFHSTYDVILFNIISSCLFPLIWLMVCFPPLETRSPVGRDPHILAGRRSQAADGEPTGKNTHIRRVS